LLVGAAGFVATQGYFTEMLDKPSSTPPEGRALAFKSVTPRRFLNARPLVLVVDDDIDVRLIYRTYLRAQGCRVLTARDGKHGAAKALRFKPDVIVMDLAMPRLDGWAATRLLRQQKATADTPIIAVSAVSMARDSARAAGCDAYIAKPCLPELLWWEIRLVLQDRGMLWGEMTKRRPARRKRPASRPPSSR
jgi:CheY-like chemotaxis protein